MYVAVGAPSAQDYGVLEVQRITCSKCDVTARARLYAAGAALISVSVAIILILPFELFTDPFPSLLLVVPEGFKCTDAIILSLYRHLCIETFYLQLLTVVVSGSHLLVVCLIICHMMLMQTPFKEPCCQLVFSLV